MARGFISGVFWGLVVSGGVGATMSLLDSEVTGMPSIKLASAPEAKAIETPAGSAFNQVKTDEVPVLPQTDMVVEPEAVPVSPSQVEVDETPPAVDVAPADVPDNAAPESSEGVEIVTPIAESDVAVVTAQSDAPVLPSPQVMQPAVPQTEEVSIADAETEAAPEMEAEAALDDSETAIEAETATNEEAPMDAPVMQEPEEPEQQNPAVPEANEAELAETEPAETMAPEAEASDQAPEIKVNRPPVASDDAENSDADAPDAQAVEGPDAAEDDAVKGALAAYAMPFENPDNKPIMSVILIDDAARSVPDEALENLPFALSFAIDATRDDAGVVAARYYEAGFEVLMMISLPSGAAASDIEVSFEAYSHALPNAVAVLDVEASGFKRGAASAPQIAGILSDRGLGLITPSKGLNSAQKAAEREGVASGLIYRELDAEGEDAAKISRYLDRAAFRAGQEGNVIMLGHTHPETLKALAQWVLDGGAANLAIAPVSTVLMGQ